MDARSTPEEKASTYYRYFTDNSTSKAEFSQCLASILVKKYTGKVNELTAMLPNYLKNAIYYVTEQ